MSILNKPKTAPYELLFIGTFIQNLYKSYHEGDFFARASTINSPITKESLEYMSNMKLSDEFLSWLDDNNYIQYINNGRYYLLWKTKELMFMDKQTFLHAIYER